MCLIITSPSGERIPKKHLLNGFLNNVSAKCGSGFAYAKDGKLKVKKGYFSFWEFYKNYEKTCIGNPHVIHFRLASAGSTGKENCHPFVINENLCMVHNGTIRCVKTSIMSDESDTFLFVKQFLKPIAKANPNFINVKAMRSLISETVGSYNKLVFLSNTGKISIVNKDEGAILNKKWYSNSSFMPVKPRKLIQSSGFNRNSGRFYPPDPSRVQDGLRHYKLDRQDSPPFDIDSDTDEKKTIIDIEAEFERIEAEMVEQQKMEDEGAPFGSMHQHELDLEEYFKDKARLF